MRRARYFLPLALRFRSNRASAPTAGRCRGVCRAATSGASVYSAPPSGAWPQLRRRVIELVAPRARSRGGPPLEKFAAPPRTNASSAIRSSQRESRGRWRRFYDQSKELLPQLPRRRQSGPKVLHEEALATLKRARPLRAPLMDIADNQLSFAPPIRYAKSAQRSKAERRSDVLANLSSLWPRDAGLDFGELPVCIVIT